MTEQPIKDAVNLALDNLETAGFELADAGPSGLTQRLSDILRQLEEWKADVWEALDD